MDYFPLGTAKGSAFCNREQELIHLNRNIAEARPTLVMSSRRYGKTSLVLKALAQSDRLYSHIDFYRDLDEFQIERSIINGIGELLGKIESAPKKLILLANEIFSGMQVSLAFQGVELSVQFQETKKRTADNLFNALKRLHIVAEKRRKKIVLFFDEFQQLGEVVNHHAIEAVIRQVAQLSTHITYIFSGSNRHLLNNMFFDKNKPFYKLCDLIPLERIKAIDYAPYIQNAAKKRWRKTLAEELLNTIFEITERHPYYVNLLCSRLWLNETVPNYAQVQDTWKQCALENKSQIENELSLLSLNQRKLMIALARVGPVRYPTGKEFLKETSLSQTSLSQALSVLVEKDYVYQDSAGQFCLMEPLIRYLLSADIKATSG